MSAIDDERTRLAKLLHKLLSVESSTCSAFDLLSVVETMDLASRLELQSNSCIVDSDGQTASSDSMPAATTDPRSKELAKLWRAHHRINQSEHARSRVLVLPLEKHVNMFAVQRLSQRSL
jgi:hypothetical protein